jgi:hypothetical protein
VPAQPDARHHPDAHHTHQSEPADRDTTARQRRPIAFVALPTVAPAEYVVELRQPRRHRCLGRVYREQTGRWAALGVSSISWTPPLPTRRAAACWLLDRIHCPTDAAAQVRRWATHWPGRYEQVVLLAEADLLDRLALAHPGGQGSPVAQPRGADAPDTAHTLRHDAADRNVYRDRSSRTW